MSALPPDGPLSFNLILSETELLLVNNALNEICNGIDIDDDEFCTRFGANRSTARALLKRVGQLIGGSQASEDLE